METKSPQSGFVLVVLLLVALVWGLTGLRASAQPRGPTADSTKTRALDAALERLAAAAEVSLVYDAALVQGHDAPCAVDGDAPVATLRCLLDGTGLDFVQTSGGTYVIKRSARRPPQRGSIQGTVRTAETGAPLPRAHVRAVSAERGAVTDEGGRFQLSGLVAGPYTLVVSHLGYETARETVWVSPTDPTRPTIRLTATSVSADSVVVNASERKESSTLDAQATLSPRQLVRTSPTATPSVTHAVGSLMGIHAQAPYADLHVQGSASSEHEVRLDGVPVRNPAVTGRLLSAFSPLALDGLTARKAGFGASKGDVLSGVIELEHDLHRENAHYGTVRADPVSVNGRGEGTFSVGKTDASVMGAARISLWDLHQSQALSRLIDTWSALDPALTAAQIAADSSFTGGSFAGKRTQPHSRFVDLHGAARIPLGSTRHLYVSSYHGRSSLGTDLVSRPGASSGALTDPSGSGTMDNVLVPASDRYTWTNTLAQTRYESRLSEETTGTLRAFLSRYRARSDYETGVLQNAAHDRSDRTPQSQSPRGSQSTNAVTEVGLRGTLNRTLSDRNQLTLSANVTSLDTRVRLSNPFLGFFRHADRTLRATAVGRAEVALGPFTTVSGGLRLTARSSRASVHAEPRAALRYHRPHTSIGGVTLRIGGGIYRQYTTQFELNRDGATAVVPTVQVWMPVPSGLSPPRSYHLAIDAAWAPTPVWSMRIESYAKWHPSLLAVDYPALRRGTGLRSPTRVLSSSEGRTIGGGVQTSYEGRWATGTLRYTYTRTRRTFPGRFDGRRVPPPWNEPHRLMLRGRVPVFGGVALTVHGNGIWGRSWGYRRGYYSYLNPDDFDGDGPDLTRPSTHQLPPLYRVDAGLVATQHWGDVAVTGQIRFMNLLGRNNVADWGLRPTNTEEVTRHPRLLPGRWSVISLQIRY